MKEIVGIQFKNNSRLYYFAPNGESFKLNDFAIVETVRGMEIGKVIIANRMVEDDEVMFELKDVIRKANNEDIKREEKHQALAPKNFAFFKKTISELNLDMKPLYCEYTIDGSKLIFYYTSDDRVDFRNLLKVLASEFKTRIELRQIGPREAARIVGGIGPCGRVICCKSCLNSFDFVTMKMAKDQDMSLNISKISGICGKLLCCIEYEHEMYCELKNELPKNNEIVKTPNSNAAKVVSVDLLKKIVTVVEKIDGNEVQTKYESKEITRLCVKDPMKDDSKKTAEMEAPVETKKETQEEKPSEEPQGSNNSNKKNGKSNNKKKYYHLKHKENKPKAE